MTMQITGLLTYNEEDEKHIVLEMGVDKVDIYPTIENFLFLNAGKAASLKNSGNNSSESGILSVCVNNASTTIIKIDNVSSIHLRDPKNMEYHNIYSILKSALKRYNKTMVHFTADKNHFLVNFDGVGASVD